MLQKKEEVATTQEGLVKWEMSDGKKIFYKDLKSVNSRFQSMSPRASILLMSVLVYTH
jgi:hypothetical protein